MIIVATNEGHDLNESKKLGEGEAGGATDSLF